MGGLVASAETVAQTLERETQEEAGLSIDTLLGVEACGSFTVHRSPCAGLSRTPAAPRLYGGNAACRALRGSCNGYTVQPRR